MTAELKDELVAQADALGIPGAHDMTKDELRAAIDARNPEALGPVIPEGQSAPAPEQHGRAAVGVQPKTRDDIPEAGR